MEIELIINQQDVYEEVAQTTSYTGAKMDADPKAYERIFATDADRSQLRRFWTESCSAVCEKLKKFLEEENDTGEEFRLRLNVSQSFDTALRPSMEKELFSFFVMNITGKWYVFTNKGEAADYGVTAAALLESVHRKACYKKKPTRPVYD